MYFKTLNMELKPIVSWPGNKVSQSANIVSHFPDPSLPFIEPFLGSASILFALQPRYAIVNDINSVLVDMYRWIEHDVDAFIDALTALAAHFNRIAAREPDADRARAKWFYDLRDHFNDLKGIFHSSSDLTPYNNTDNVHAYNNHNIQHSLECVVAFLVLNKLSFKGLYRENSKGHFNVPFMHSCKSLNFDIDNIKSVSKFFNTNCIVFYNTDILHFQDLVKTVDKANWYLDPPFFPCETSRFTSYASRNEQNYMDPESMHSQLFSWAGKLNGSIVISNSQTSQTETWARDNGFVHETVTIPCRFGIKQTTESLFYKSIF